MPGYLKEGSSHIRQPYLLNCRSYYLLREDRMRHRLTQKQWQKPLIAPASLLNGVGHALAFSGLKLCVNDAVID
jgi:hypothetical protein